MIAVVNAKIAKMITNAPTVMLGQATETTPMMIARIPRQSRDRETLENTVFLPVS
jgi:hypothetical protein